MNLKRLFMAFVVTVFAYISQANAQDKVVTGKVTDANGASVSGVTIRLKNGKTVGNTNSDGTFSIKVPAGATLAFSSVGYGATEMQVPASGAMTVSMKSGNDNLNEVVVIGYGSAKKKDLTGSVATVSSKDFVKGAMTSPDQLITGKVAGVSIVNSGGAPGAGAAIRIRGGASVGGSNEPLIIIDDVPMDQNGISGVANPLALLNPNDIETFTVLKDASAAAIYGSRASNGVILITTKKGKLGKPSYNFTSTFAVYTPAKKVDVMSASEFRNYVNANGTKAYRDQLGNANVDWQDQIYQSAIGSDNNISMSGSIFGKVPFRASVGYLNQQGILRTGSLKRTTASINATPKFFKDHLKIDVNIKGIVSDSRFANEGAIGAALTANPTQPIYNSDPKFKIYNGYNEVLGARPNGLREGATLNPLGLLNDYYNISHVERSIGNIKLDYKFHFLPDLRIVANLGYDISRGRGNINVADSTGQGYKRFEVSGTWHSGVNNQYLQERANFVADAYLNYAKSTKYGDIDFLLGQSFQENRLKSYNFQDNANDGAIKDPKTFYAPFGLGQNAIASYYSRLKWAFEDKYIATFSYRTDGSSRFTQRWGDFYSGALAWRISKESFMKNVKFVNDLKLRAGVGQTGNQDGIGDYGNQALYQQALNQSAYQFGNSVIMVNTPLAYVTDRRFTWEKTTMYNYGVDFTLFNNKLSGSIEYYKRNTTNLFFAANLSSLSSLANIQTKNNGSLSNEGVDVTLNTTILKKKDFVWDVQANFNYNKNTITQVYAEVNSNVPGLLTGGIAGGVGNTIQIQAVGQNTNAFYAYKQVYDNSGRPIDGVYEDINRDGTINEKDLTIYKAPFPTMTAGLTMNFGYKNWNFGFVARAAFDQYIYNNIRSNMGVSARILESFNTNLKNGSTEVLATNLTGTNVNSVKSNYWIENASFFRVDNINIGYNFGKVFKGAANLRVTGNIQNAFVITKYTGLDPEVFGGIDNTIYARPRVFVLGVSLDF